MIELAGEEAMVLTDEDIEKLHREWQEKDRRATLAFHKWKLAQHKWKLAQMEKEEKNGNDDRV